MMRRLVGVLAVMVLAGCSAGADAEDDAGPIETSVGESVTVTYPMGEETGTKLVVGTAELTKAPRRDLALYRIPAGMRTYYARVAVANRGPDEASFEDGLPWWLRTADDVLIPPSTSPRGLADCGGLRLPEPLPAGESTKGCLMFLVPRGTVVESVDFQPGDVTTAVRWRP